jgi:hypothetical protein
MPHDELSAVPHGFRLLVSPITTSAVDVSVFVGLVHVADLALRRQKYLFELDAVVLFPIIAEKLIYSRENFVVHKRSSNAYYVGRNLDFDEWRSSRRRRRITLALDNVVKSITQIPARNFAEESKERVWAALTRAAVKIREQ